MSDMKQVLVDFDAYLKEKGLEFECVLIGGAALLIMDVVNRITRDADVLDPSIPEPIKEASEAFAEKYENGELGANWFNDTANAFSHNLPKGWRTRTKTILKGEALTFHTLGREDFLKMKLYAYCNRGTDLDDLKSLNITDTEIEEATPWVKERMPEDLFKDQVEVSLEILKEELSLDDDFGLEM